ncbi:MAG: hypothetical protein IT437_09790 [Phycisphaerales bacterium]|nr:hypothetical protein [Phycisphaerales bacterium]
MRQTTQRKALAAVLGLGAVALLVDRLVPGPAPADAAPPETPRAATEAAPAAPSAAAPLASASGAGQVSRNLLGALDATFWDDAAVKASLRPTPQWALFADPEPARAAPAQSIEGRFCQQYKLTSVIGGETPAVIIEDAGKPRVLQIGSELGGFRLVRVERGVARFEAGAQHVELTVTQPQDTKK